VVTKRGTKDFRGGVYDFLRNDRFDSVNLITQQKDKLSLKDFGWNLGGPLVLHMANADNARLFFFAGQEYKKLESKVGLTKITAVPTVARRSGGVSHSP